MNSNKKPNQLINETSPYLLKHAYNPVDWWSWCEEAFDKAEMDNKPIFVSIGYYSCHWCNVMEKESFEDLNIAQFLNKYFVSIKVDREELPDVDHQYQLIFQLMHSRGGGWPLTVFMTPNKVPFFTGTYFPPKSKVGMTGFFDLIQQIETAYKTQQNKILNSKDSILANLKSIQDRLQGDLINSIPEENLIEASALELASMYDKNNAGFGSAPKFPHESALSFLLSEGIRQKKESYIKIVKYSLEAMSNGGIYDQLGGGFHRYSVDNYWLVPHFEKMLYTQAQMSDVLIDMYQISKEQYFLNKSIETLDYVIRELKSSEGGFYSGADADSEGVEGKFFIWTKKEIDQILGKEEAEIFCTLFDVTSKGNFEGKNILHVRSSIKQLAKNKNRSEEEIKEIIKQSKEKLFSHRSKRISPGIDRKILSGWSALVIKPLLRLSSILESENESINKFSTVAKQTLDFLRDKMIRDGVLYRVYGFSNDNLKSLGNNVKILGYLEDYVYVALAMIEGFEHFLDYSYFHSALNLVNGLIDEFWDHENGAFFYSREIHNTPMSRFKDIFDSPLPSPNSLAVILFHKLYFFTEDSSYLEYANKILMTFNGAAQQKSGLGMASYFHSLAWTHNHNSELILIVNDSINKSNNDHIWNYIQKSFIPSRIQLKINNSLSNLPKEFHNRSWIQGKSIKHNKSALYICRNFVCSAPITNIDETKAYIEKNFSIVK